MSDGGRGHGSTMRMRPRNGDEWAVREHLTAWHRTVGRVMPGTRLHLMLRSEDGSGELVALHMFESAATYHRAMESAEHRAWFEALSPLVEGVPDVTDVAVGWNAAADARPRVSVSIDRDVHASVQDLVGRLVDRHPRTPAEDAYLEMLQSVAADYEREFPATVPEEGDFR